MKNILAKALVLLICVLMAVPVTAVGEIAQAEDVINVTVPSVSVNAAYIVGDSTNDVHADTPFGGTETFSDPESAGQYILEHAKQREEVIDYMYTIVASASGDYQAVINESLASLYAAIKSTLYGHNGIPDEGDYMGRHLTGEMYSGPAPDMNIDYEYNYSDNTFIFTLYMRFTAFYHSTAVQEEQVTAAVKNLKANLSLDGKSNYEIVKAVHDWICGNVTYDYTYSKYAAYNALIEGTSVCQGYANLFYRLMLEYGIDCRIIAGLGKNGVNGSGEPHAWNIVKLGGKYYNVDCTWDSTQYGVKYDYFLNNTSAFTSKHIPEADSILDPTTAEFAAAYPMGEGIYDPSAHEHTPAEERSKVKEATCTEDGYTGDIVCSECGEVITPGEAIPAKGHEYGDDDICDVCGFDRSKVTLGDINGDGDVKNNDAVLLLRFIAGYDVDIVKEACDIDGDGEIKNNDAVLLLRKIAGY